MLFRVLKTLINRPLTAIMSESSSELMITSTKRQAEFDDKLNESDVKKVKVDSSSGERAKSKPPKRKKFALLTVYSGKGYHGVQIQSKESNLITIESVLCEALLKANLIEPEHLDDMSKMWFQRASRTDKGVSAAGQVFSLLINIDEPVDKINHYLPPNIKAIAIQRVTKNFDSKNACDKRTYQYLCPTFAFAPVEKVTNEDFRMDENLRKQIETTMAHFKGTHNFHNFTSRRTFSDKSAKRYMISFEAGKPFLWKGVEFMVITVKGQSFMLHQIRKMIGITIAIIRGLASLETIDLCWGPHKVDIPKAPGLGLLLDKLHYDAYNRKFGTDGIHEMLDWSKYQDKIETFKNEHIYADIMDTELAEKSMFNWLSTLSLHTFQVYLDRPSTIRPDSDEELSTNGGTTALDTQPETSANPQSTKACDDVVESQTLDEEGKIISTN